MPFSELHIIHFTLLNQPHHRIAAILHLLFTGYCIFYQQELLQLENPYPDDIVYIRKCALQS